MQDIVFIDSTASLKAHNLCVTFVLVSTPAGAMPIGMFISRNMTTDAYAECFRLLSTVSEQTFINGLREIITDDYTALRQAVRGVS